MYNIYTTNDIERIHKGYWFSKDSMRFFKSSVLGEVYHGDGVVFFVSSEKAPWRGIDGYFSTRRYSVRCYDIAKDSITTVGVFQGYDTASKAKTQAKREALKSLEAHT